MQGLPPARITVFPWPAFASLLAVTPGSSAAPPETLARQPAWSVRAAFAGLAVESTSTLARALSASLSVLPPSSSTLTRPSASPSLCLHAAKCTNSAALMGRPSVRAQVSSAETTSAFLAAGCVLTLCEYILLYSTTLHLVGYLDGVLCSVLWQLLDAVHGLEGDLPPVLACVLSRLHSYHL
jgi:hypothetical protein